ncbi:hypothetical protein E2P81_ATG10114 [Venturia nashicola]|uniref:SET domain-containing protein n=1 Tax=Venturia nashicola TaxID=86259 RepID=A0A4Z1NBR0_9PEZI|nr:hypothetical protein E6O75_ATG10334 [Venturia nashicola]TLD14573.1 hypothetical protein E2P81_ATG10114 [Venturia nashicola]
MTPEQSPLEEIARTDLFNLEPIPGKGKGLIAAQAIPAGTCLISENPLFTTAEIKSNDVERELVRIVKALPKDSQRAFLSLHNNSPGGKEPFSNIVRSNGYPLGASSEIGGIFPNIARINHSCWANCQQAWSSIRKQETAYAVRQIEPGEELTIAYTIGGPSQERKSKLKGFFGFDCRCEICSLPADKQKQSDAKYIRAAKLDESIGNPKRVKNSPNFALADCHALLKLYNEEKIADNRLQRLYYDAFQICVLHSDQARARVFAKRCAESRAVCEGGDSADVMEMLAYSEKPSSHDSFGGSTKWKQAVDAVPTDLASDKFEEWLWKLG